MLFIYSLYVIVVSPTTAEGDDGRAAPFSLPSSLQVGVMPAVLMMKVASVLDNRDRTGAMALF